MKPFARPFDPALHTMLAVVAVALAFVSVSPVAAQDDNPFARPAPTQAAPAAAASPLDTLELRGVATLGEQTFVTLFDTSTSRSTVVTLGSTVNGLTVSDYQRGDDSVRVQSGGRERRVQIKKAQIVTMATPPPTQAPPPGGPPGVGAPPGPGQAPAMDDQAVQDRMRRVADEIRRRREMRRDLMQRAQQQMQQQQQQNPQQ